MSREVVCRGGVCSLGALAAALLVGAAARTAMAAEPEPSGMSAPISDTETREARLDPSSHADNYAALWGRLDVERTGVTLSAGGTEPIGRVDLAYNLVVSQAFAGVVDPLQSAAFTGALGDGYRAPSLRLELGPALAWGGLFLLPKLGIGYDVERARVAPLVPQLLAIVQGGPLYLELWQQLFLYDLFEPGAQDSFYTRDALLVALGRRVSAGVQVEATLAVHNTGGDVTRSLPLGAVANLELGLPLTLGLFLGYETQPEARNRGSEWLSARFTLAALLP